MIQITLYEDFVIPLLPQKPESFVEAASLQWFQGLAVRFGYGPNYDWHKGIGINSSDNRTAMHRSQIEQQNTMM
jgi:hypothetical protein